MGKGKKPQDEQEVLGQIFDFIFAQAKKDPKKRRPIKIKSTGISTSGAVVDGVVAALEKPGLLLTDQALGSMNDALSIELGKLNADEVGAFKAKVTTTNLIDFLSDPDKFLEKPRQAAKKAMRETMRAEYLGKMVQEINARAWAHKYNLDLDTKQAIAGHYAAERVTKGKSEEVATAAFTVASGAAANFTRDSDKGFIARRTIDLLENEILLTGGGNIISSDRREGLEKAIRTGKRDNVVKYIQDTFGTLSPAYANRAIARLDDALQVTGGNIDIFSEKNYLRLESRNLSKRAEHMQDYIANHKNLTPTEVANLNQGIVRLNQANVIVSGQHWNSEDLVTARVEMVQRINDAKAELTKAQKNNDKSAIKYYREEIKNLRNGSRELNSMEFWGNVGKAEGWVNSWKGLMGGVGAENYVSSILDGSFFDKNANPMFFNPCKDGKVKFGKGGGIDIHLARTKKIVRGKRVDENPIIAKYNGVMTDLYYWTPKSLMKSLFVNGEGFVYLAAKKAQKMGIWTNLDEDFDINKILDGSLIQTLKNKGFKNKDIAKMTRLGKWAKAFSAGQRMRDRMKSWIEDKFYKKFRKKIYDSLVKRITNGVAREYLEKWLEKGGFQVIGKALAVTILNALGIAATGGLGSFLIPIISGVVVDVLYSGAKIIIQFALIIICGVIGLVWFTSDSSKKSFDSQTYAYTNVVPGEVVDNPNYTGTNPITGEDDPDHELDPFLGGTLPDGEKCLLGSGSYHCSQGPYGSYSHQNVAAIDVTGVDYFYAPVFCGNENCTVTYSGSAYCGDGYAGGMLKFTATYGGDTYEFTLIHINSTYGVGSKLSSGQRVARVMTIDETTRACSSGKHIHIQARMNGAIVNPRDVLTAGASKGGFACNISECDP